MVELLIVVVIIGILASVTIPQLRQAHRRAEISALMTEATHFSKALLLYNLDNGEYPSDAVFDTTTLEPLVSAQQLRADSFLRLLRDREIHEYDFDPTDGDPLEWHCHPRMIPYDNGAQMIDIKGVGTAITVTYMGQTYDSSSILRVIQ